MDELFTRQFLESVNKSNFPNIKDNIWQNPDIINCFNKDKRNAMYFAVKNKNIEIIKYLFDQGIDISLDDIEGNLIMHHAANLENKHIILILLMNNAQIDKLNDEGKKPGQGNINIKLFIEKVYSEKKAFKVLKKEEEQKLIEIFKDIDFKKKGFLNLEDAKYFNLFVDKKISRIMAEKDGKDFIKSTSIINGETVNIDEWLFAFSKLFVCEERTFNRFIKDYDQVIKEFESFENWFKQNYDNN